MYINRSDIIGKGWDLGTKLVYDRHTGKWSVAAKSERADAKICRITDPGEAVQILLRI